MRTLSAALAAAVDAGKLPSNPATGIRRLSTDTVRRDALSAEQAEAIRAALPTQRDRLMWGLLYLAGLRTEEALALRWQDIRGLSRTGGRIAVDRVFVAGEIRQRTKTGAGRDVEIIAALAEDLIRHHEQTAPTSGDDLVCPSRVGTPILPGELAQSRLAAGCGRRRRIVGNALHGAAHVHLADDSRGGVAGRRGGVRGAHIGGDNLEALRPHVRWGTHHGGGPDGSDSPGGAARGAPKWLGPSIRRVQRDRAAVTLLETQKARQSGPFAQCGLRD